MPANNPHLLKRSSLFALFCLSYFPLFLLVAAKVLLAKQKFLFFGGINGKAVLVFIENFGFLIILLLLAIYSVFGTLLTLKNIKNKKTNAYPVIVKTIKPKNEQALSYLGTYVIPLLIKGDVGIFEYVTFIILFFIYYQLYASSSLILINPVLNLFYGLYEIEFFYPGKEEKSQTAMVISQQQWLNEHDQLKLLKLSHSLYYAF